jgi:hypothetical protein
MPIYEATCEECGTDYEYIRPHTACYDTPTCCGGATRKVIRTSPTVYVSGEFKPFTSHVDGSIISNKREFAEHNARNDVVSVGDMYTKDELMNAKPKVETSHIEDVKTDLVEAYQMVKQGYKPKMEMDDGQV